MQALALLRGEHGDGAVAGPAQPFEQGAFGQHFLPAWLVVDRGEKLARAIVAGAAFDTDGGLRRRGQPFLRIEPRAGIVLAQPHQARSGKESRVGLARFQLGHTGGDIAANADHLEIGAGMEQLRSPARGAGAHPRACRYGRDRCCAQQHVGLVRAWQDSADGQRIGADRLHVLHRMDRSVDAPFVQPDVEFSGPQRLAADFGERAILDPVAAGDNGDEFDCPDVPAVGSA